MRNRPTGWWSSGQQAPRKSATASEASAIRGDPKAPEWTRRIRIGAAPQERPICPYRMGHLEISVRDCAENPADSVVKPELGTSFDSLNEAYDFYNLCSWENGFGVRYAKSRLKDIISRSGIARGCGWQHLGAYVNLGSFYLFEVPMSLLLGFVLKLGGKGLWMGISCGSIVHFLLLAIITFFSNWQKSDKARERAFGASTVEKGTAAV